MRELLGLTEIFCTMTGLDDTAQGISKTHKILYLRSLSFTNVNQVHAEVLRNVHNLSQNASIVRWSGQIYDKATKEIDPK